MVNALYILNQNAYEKIYGPDQRAVVDEYAHVLAPPQTAASIKENMDLLKTVDVIFSGWGAPKMDAAFLNHAPNLKAVFYGAGSIRYFVSDAFWERDITVTSSYAANAVPVAEFTLAQILFSLKQGWRYMYQTKTDHHYAKTIPVQGAYKRTVGIISLGMIGQLVCQLLQPFDLNIIAYDPFVQQADVDEWNVELCGLDELFERADVVSVHTPWLKETEGMIRGAHFEAMQEQATFMNTSRGAIVQEDEMIAVLQKRSDLTAVLDVTYPEPPQADSPLYTLPNVFLTPHIAGSLGDECQRMGEYAVREFERFMRGEPLQWEITKEKAAFLA